MKSFNILIVSLFLSVGAQANHLTKSLTPSDSLARVAKAVGTQFSDGNITTGGVTALSAARLVPRLPKTISGQRSLGLELFKEAFKSSQEEELPADNAISYRAGLFQNATVSKLVDAVIESNDYNPDNKEIKSNLARSVWAVLRQLPVSESSVVLWVESSFESNITESVKKVRYFAVVDPETNKVIELFTVEGTM